jgi:hypothetical protein
MSLDKPLHLKKKVSGRCALPGGHKQKSYAPKYGQGKTILDLFRDFLEKTPMSKLFLCVNAFPWNRIFFFFKWQPSNILLIFIPPFFLQMT